MITIDEFKNVELKIGRIVSVSEHPNATKLYVMRVDLGDGERQIVAGIRPYYAPEQLVGRRIVVVANLQPAVLRGVESQGMLLACQDGDRVTILQPDGEPAPGSRVS